MSRVTMQEIADEVGVSRVTVWKALNNKPGVSDKTTRRVIEAQKRMTTLRKAQHSPIQTYDQIENISIATSHLDTSFFWGDIVNTIAKELQSKGVNLVLTPIVSSDNTITDRDTLQAAIEQGNTQGMLVINVYDEESVDFLSTLNIPKVYMDTIPHKEPEDIGGDILIVEGTTSIRKIIGRMVEKGHRNIGYIGDINYAKSTVSRYNGYLMGLSDHNIPLEAMAPYCLLEAHRLTDYKKEIIRHLDKLLAQDNLPHAFVCESDMAADFVMRHLAQRDIVMNKDILITGFNNCPDYFTTSQPSATVTVNTEMIGQQLLTILLYRIRFPQADYSDIYLRSQVQYNHVLE